MDDRVYGLDRTLVLGGGLAGLSAAYQLTAENVSVTVIEASEKIGGLARTIEHNGFRFDLGGHRFVTHDKNLEKFVKTLLEEDYLEVPRSSKILLRGRYFDYPLRPLKAFFGFGPIMSVKILADYFFEQLRSQFFKRSPVSLEDWVVNHYGRTMFNLYFKDYSEKVWGIDCQLIDQSWVEQRIQGLSLAKVIAKSLLPTINKTPITLANRFIYPKKGIGEITDTLAAKIREKNSIYTQTKVQQVHHQGSKIKSIETSCNGQAEQFNARHFISTIPLPELVKYLHPSPPKNVLEAASQLQSRDLVTVTLMINRPRVTDQTWIYVPEKSIPFGRVHEPTNWSKEMSTDGKSLLVVEYFCFRGDKTWNSEDKELADETSRILVKLGLVKNKDILDHKVLRVANAYPLFNVGFKEHCSTIYQYLEHFDNLFTAGRGGMFRYYNMDHAMQAGFDASNFVLKNQAKIMETIDFK